MVDRAEIVVVGGGILGLSTALELCRAGARGVKVIERGEPGGATTQAGAGFLDFWAVTQAGAEEEIAVEQYSAQRYAELADRHEIGYAQRGNVWLAQTEAAWERKLRPLLEHPATEKAERLTPREAAELVPVLEPEGIFAAVHQPTAASLTTAAAALAMAEEIAAAGGTVETSNPATGIEVTGGRVSGVTTATGELAADAVVVAAGGWTNALLEPLGVWIPMVPLAASRFITPPASIPPDMPSLLLPEKHDLYVREYNGGLSWGCLYEASPRYEFAGGQPPIPTHQLSAEARGEMLAIAEEMSATIPSLRRLPRSSVHTGFPSHTPDYRAVLGPIAGIDGLWVAAGDNYAGVTHGPGFGRLLADQLLGRPTVVASAPFAPSRFADERFRKAADVLEAPLVKTAGWA